MGIDCGPAPEIKWTEHCGKIMEVQIFRNEKGECTGFHPIKHRGYHGVSWVGTLGELPKDGFFNTAEEAVVGLCEKYNKRAAEMRTVVKWLESELKKNQDLAESIENRISNLSQDVLR